MDLKNLTGTQIEKGLTDSGMVKPSIASSDQPPTTPVPVQQLKTLQALMQNLQLGKVFDVVVARVEGNTLFLNIPGSPADSPLLQAEMNTPLPVGTRLTLQLTNESARPELKVIATPNSPQDPVSQNLRSSLQQQQPLPPLLANLNVLARTPARLNTALPDEVLEVTRQVVQQLPDSRQVSKAQGLKLALKQAGPYLENALATNTLVTGARPELRLPVTPSVDGLKLSQQAVTAATQALEEEVLNPNKEIDRNIAQAIQNMVQAMRQQPLQDVRANLLRLATLLRSLNEQNQSLHKQTLSQENLTTLAQTTRPAAPQSSGALPPLQTTSTAKPADVVAGNPVVTPKADGATEFSGAMRSQTPQPQAQAANASLTGLLNQKSAMEELLTQVDGALSRIHVQQLQTVATEQQHRPSWVIELPVRTEQGIDLFDLRIQRDHQNHDHDDPKAPWTVTLAFDLDRMGPVRVQVTLYGEDNISAVIWAEQRATSILFNHYLDNLKSRLRQVGLAVGQLNCRCGKPDSPPPSTEPRLVDEKV